MLALVAIIVFFFFFFVSILVWATRRDDRAEERTTERTGIWLNAHPHRKCSNLSKTPFVVIANEEHGTEVYIYYDKGVFLAKSK